MIRATSGAAGWSGSSFTRARSALPRTTLSTPRSSCAIVHGVLPTPSCSRGRVATRLTQLRQSPRSALHGAGLELRADLPVDIGRAFDELADERVTLRVSGPS